MDTETIIANYFKAYEAANGSEKNRPVVTVTSVPGWVEFDHKRMGRKTLVEMTERLNNRVAGKGQVTNSEFIQINT